MAQGLLLKSLGAGFVGLRAPPCALLELNSCRRLGQWPTQISKSINIGSVRIRRQCGNRRLIVKAVVDPWAPGAALDSQSIASSLFAGSLFPYLGFLYHITKSKTSPPMTLFGFYFLLAFVGATTKIHYGTSLSNVDWLHGGAESLLTLTNLFIVFGLRGALRNAEENGKQVEVKVEEENVPFSK
ncbi:hypothetical protein Mapa_013819 [Marchantia paleacea]|nr:hypothetical protein Mapa_013819 [Marchantia paleacea]